MYTVLEYHTRGPLEFEIPMVCKTALRFEVLCAWSPSAMRVRMVYCHRVVAAVALPTSSKMGWVYARSADEQSVMTAG